MITTTYFDDLQKLSLNMINIKNTSTYLYRKGFSYSEVTKIVEEKICLCCRSSMLLELFDLSRKHKDGRSDFSIECTIKRKRLQNKKIRERKKQYLNDRAKTLQLLQD